MKNARRVGFCVAVLWAWVPASCLALVLTGDAPDPPLVLAGFLVGVVPACRILSVGGGPAMTMGEWKKKCDEDFAESARSGEVDRVRAEMESGYYHTLDPRMDDHMLPGPAVEQKSEWAASELADAAGREQLDLGVQPVERLAR